MHEHEGSYQVTKGPCPKCQAKGEDSSGDNQVSYSDGHKFCFACRTYTKADGSVPIDAPLKVLAKDWSPINGEIVELSNRRISEAICKQYNYRVKVNSKNGQLVHVSSFYDKDRVLQAQHLRFPDKQFRWIGNATKVQLFGQHLWKMGGRKLTITEGEIDCLSVAQMQDGRWPVVSLPGGAAGAVKAIKDNYEFVSSYEEIILCFDNDAAGIKASKEVADILPPGKVRIITSPRKDANEHLIHNDTKSFMQSFWEAKAYRPDGILHASEIVLDSTVNQDVWETPYDGLTEFLVGQRPCEITMWTSGTGSGKSTIIRELVAGHLAQGRPVGMLMLEESPTETLDDIISLTLGKPVRRIKAARKLNDLRGRLGKAPLNIGVVDDLTELEYNDARSQVNSTGLYIYDHYGSADFDNLIAKVEYMAISLGVKVIVLDHVTAAVAGMLGDEMNSERLLIDKFMKDLRNLVERTGIHLDLVSQLRKSDGKGYEEGEQITLSALRGSGSLASVPNTIIAMERNRQHPDKRVSNTSILRILKNRFTGRCGVASALEYTETTGRLKEVPFTVQGDGSVSFGDTPTEQPFGDERETPNVFGDSTEGRAPEPALTV